nr:hypothetical protein [Tanacetum cinerariifolium]
LAATAFAEPEVEISLQRDKKAEKEKEKIRLDQFIEVKGWKAMGNKLNYFKIHTLSLLTDEGPEPARREVKKRGAAPKPDEADAALSPEPNGAVEVTAEEVAQSQALLRRPWLGRAGRRARRLRPKNDHLATLTAGDNGTRRAYQFSKEEGFARSRFGGSAAALAQCQRAASQVQGLGGAG